MLFIYIKMCKSQKALQFLYPKEGAMIIGNSMSAGAAANVTSPQPMLPAPEDKRASLKTESTAAQDVVTLGKPGQSTPSASAGANAAEEYQKMGKLQTPREVENEGYKATAAKEQERVNEASEPAAQAAAAANRVTSPVQVRQLMNNLANKPDAALMSAISIYA